MIKKEKKEDENIVYVGSKPFQNYIMAIQMQLEKNPTVIIKSRGKFTSRVIDLTEVMKSKQDVTVDNIEIDSETFTKEEEGQEPRDIHVSTISITISRRGE